MAICGSGLVADLYLYVVIDQTIVIIFPGGEAMAKGRENKKRFTSSTTNGVKESRFRAQ